MNKKILIGIIISILVIVGIIIYFLIDRQNSNIIKIPNESIRIESDEDTKVNTDGKKSLVVYFSLPDSEEDDSTVTVDGEKLGNTQYVANIIKDEVGADIYRIESLTPYTTNHSELTRVAQEEQNSDARPAIKNRIENFDDYDIIYLGYPIWWSDMPQIIYTFLELYDFNEKTIIPFSTHGGSGLSGTVESIKSALPNTTVIENAFSIYRDDMEEAPSKVNNWLKEIEVLN